MKKIERFTGIAVMALVATTLMALAPAAVAAEGENMLYLVEFEATEAGAPTTPEQAITLLDQLIVPSLDKLSKDGKIRAQK